MIYLKLTNRELKNIKGGISAWAIIGIIAGAIFGIGGVDGYARPLPCKR